MLYKCHSVIWKDPYLLAKESQSKVAKEVSNANDILAKVKSEIEKVKHAAIGKLHYDGSYNNLE